MRTKKAAFKNSDINKLLFAFSSAVAAECLLGMVNSYRFAVTGAIFEILWLPVIALAFGVPLAAIFCLFRDRFNPRSLNYYSILIIAAAVGIFVLAR